MLCFKWKQCLNISILPFSSLPFSKTLLQISATKILVRPPKKKRNGLRLGRIRLIGTRYRKEKKTYLNIEKRNFEAKREKTKNNIATKKKHSPRSFFLFSPKYTSKASGFVILKASHNLTVLATRYREF